MCSQLEVRTIIAQLRERLANVFPQEQFDIILFGSYARHDADDESDIDVMFLVDSSRQTIQEKHWQIGEAAAEVLMDFGIVVSPIVENRAYYHANADLLPFFRNVQREGVRIVA
ncbi:MAG: nucleotidyltransferase domain-containing protein [Clostridia bacterium]|nr:nucleotidyltransferase domain-containing protein [Clostridia bacterium]